MLTGQGKAELLNDFIWLLSFPAGRWSTKRISGRGNWKLRQEETEMEHAASARDFRWLGRTLPLRSPARGRWPVVGK